MHMRTREDIDREDYIDFTEMNVKRMDERSIFPMRDNYHQNKKPNNKPN